MSVFLKELKEKRIKLANTIEDIRSAWNGKERQMPGDVEERLDKALRDWDEIETKISREEKAERVGKFANGTADLLRQTPNDGRRMNEEERKAFRKFLQHGERVLSAQELGTLKAYQADDMVGGGFFVTPVDVYDQILTLMKDLTFVRAQGTVIPMPTADSLGVPTIDTDPSDTDWTTELRTGNEENTALAGFRQMKPHPMAKQIKLSRTLVRKAPNFEEILLDRLAYKVAVTEEKAFLTGTGAQQPLGIFVSDARGIGASRDVTAAGAAAITGDDLLNVYFKLKAAYRRKATWTVSRTVLQAIRKLKDQNNNYLWATGVGPGQGFQGTAATIMGLPYNESEYAPGTISTGQYTVALGDMSFYWIVDALDMTMQVLDQLYAATNQIGYILRKETDGQVVQEEAFARLKQA